MFHCGTKQTARAKLLSEDTGSWPAQTPVQPPWSKERSTRWLNSQESTSPYFGAWSGEGNLFPTARHEHHSIYIIVVEVGYDMAWYSIIWQGAAKIPQLIQVNFKSGIPKVMVRRRKPTSKDFMTSCHGLRWFSNIPWIEWWNDYLKLETRVQMGSTWMVRIECHYTRKNRTILPRNLTILLARFWQGLGWFAYEKSTDKSPYGFLEAHLRSVRAFQTTTPESGVRSRWEGGRHLRYNCSILCEMICEQRRFRVQRYATIAYLPHRTYIHTAIPYIRFFHKRVLKLHSYMLIGSLIHICNYLI